MIHLEEKKTKQKNRNQNLYNSYSYLIQAPSYLIRKINIRHKVLLFGMKQEDIDKGTTESKRMIQNYYEQFMLVNLTNQMKWKNS